MLAANIRKSFWPLSFLYRGIVALRNFLYDRNLLRQYESALPVICVGNITTGGTGKSPFVQYLVEKLTAQGMKPVILSRGYQGKFQGPHLVTSSDLPSQVGDEVLMHYLHFQGAVPVVLAKDRVLGAKFIEREKLGEVIILDDGYQHRRLKRQVNILMLDDLAFQTTFSSKNFLPAGNLRESLKSALKRVDCVVTVSRDAQKSLQFNLPLPDFKTNLSPISFSDLFSGEKLSLNSFQGQAGVAVTGIVKYHAFFSMLSLFGIKIIEQLVFPDHYYYTKRDWLNIKSKNAPIFTTEKDGVKLKQFVAQAKEIYTLQAVIEFVSSPEEQNFLELIFKGLNASGRAKAVTQNLAPERTRTYQ